MSPTLRTAFCPVDSPFGAARSSVHPPHPSALAYSLTLPGDPLSAGIARSAVRTALRAHALERFSLPAQLAVTELIATTSRLNPGGDVYLSLRYRSETLRLVFWDQHSHHQDPDAESVCAERRRQSL